MKPEVGPVCRRQMQSGRWHSLGLCHIRVGPSLAYSRNLLSSLKTTECYFTLQSTLSWHQSSCAWQCHGVSGSLARGVDLDFHLYYAAVQNWSMRVGMFHRPLLKAATHHWYIVPNMCNNPSICPSSFLQAWNATRFKWPNCDKRCNLLQDDIRHLYDHLQVRIHVWITAREGYTLYWCDYLGTPYCDMCISFGLNLLSYTVIHLQW